jgi:hypothetical protein
VNRVSQRGIWLSLDGRELFLAFRHFPYFREATIAEVVHVTRPMPWHLRWPRLDVDLELDSIEHPERYPLTDRVTLARLRERGPRRTAAAVAQRAAAPGRRAG